MASRKQPRPVAAKTEQAPPAASWKGILIFCALAALLIAGVAYQSWRAEQVSDENQYNGFEFTPVEGGVWVTKVQIRNQPYDIPFYNHPRDLEDITVLHRDAKDLLLLRNRTVQQVFISVDPDAGAKVAAIAGVEIARITGNKYNLLNLPTTGALTRPANVTVDYPILTCADATATDLVIQFAPDPTANAIVRDEHCIILFYKTPDDAIRVADRFVYLLLGIMP